MKRQSNHLTLPCLPARLSRGMCAPVHKSPLGLTPTLIVSLKRTYKMNFHNFYGVSAADSQPKPEMNYPPTVLRVPSPDGEMVDVLVEAQEDPSSILNYDDYSITNLLKAGIQPRALHVKADRRLGSDADIEAFNARVDALADKMFNTEKD